VTRFRAGTTFIGRYVLLGVIGHGGVSVVYRALDLLNDRHVAIKMLDSTLASDPRARERIRREAVITDRMRHPSVPRVYDYGEAPQPDGTSTAYIVLELLDGTVLASYLDGGALPWLDAVGVAAAVADVLAVAHKRGVVHRDLTPANIMITDDGARIIDFGVAVTFATPEPGIYVQSPVQVSNDFAGPGQPADDVYALGVLLYQMVTGHSPVVNLPPPTATAAMRISVPTPVPAGVPRGVADICRRCTARRPGDRPGAASVALDLWALIVPMAVPLTRNAAIEPGPVIRLALAPRESPPAPADPAPADLEDTVRLVPAPASTSATA
jgi:serine/threonine protein kinase